MRRNFEIDLLSNPEDILNPNNDTDSSSFRSMESEKSLNHKQLLSKKPKKKPKNQSNIDQYPIQGTSINGFLSESSNFNNDDNLCESNIDSVTDSTTIVDSSQYQLSNEDLNQLESASDSTSIELSGNDLDSNSTNSSENIPNIKIKPSKVEKIPNTSPKPKTNNESKDETPIARLEKMLRSKITTTAPDYSKYINSPLSSRSSRNPRGTYDPLNLRPNTTKQFSNFTSIPIDSDDCRRKRNNSQSSSRNSTPRTKKGNRNTTPSTPQSPPTPISGFTVTDGHPSPREISLNIQQDPVYAATVDLIEKGEIPPQEMRCDVATLLKRKSVEYITNEQYDEAAIIENATSQLRKYIQDEPIEHKNCVMKKGLENRLQRIEAEYKIENDDWDAVLKRFKEEQEIERKKLIKMHEEEQRQFREKWSTPSMLMHFNKPSPQLLLLRKQQKSMALAKNFEEAKKIKKEADNLQKIETEEAERRAIAVMNAQYQNLLEKQKRKLECFDEHNNRSCEYVIAEKKKVTEPMQKTILSLKSGYPTYYDKWDESDASSFRSSMTQEKVAQVTPRTKKRLNDYRIQENSPKLNLNGLRLRESVANKRASSSCRVLRLPK